MGYLVSCLVAIIRRQFVVPVVSCRPIEDRGVVFLQILPRELRDVVCKPLQYVSLDVSLANDSAGFESMHDAISHSEIIGASLLCYVKPENLLFFFSERVQSLQASFFRFCRKANIPTDPVDLYGPVYQENDRRREERNGEPLAIVLCKFRNAEILKELRIREQQDATDCCDCKKITWGELQELKQKLDGISHSGDPARAETKNAGRIVSSRV
jgi:hypothetical protein